MLRAGDRIARRRRCFAGSRRICSPLKRRKELSGDFQYRMSLAAEVFEMIRRGGGGVPKADGNHEELVAMRREADDLLQGRAPFHWPLEFPGRGLGEPPSP
jgi:hypothetical protein